jgi:hypothetical protein
MKSKIPLIPRSLAQRGVLIVYIEQRTKRVVKLKRSETDRLCFNLRHQAATIAAFGRAAVYADTQVPGAANK